MVPQEDGPLACVWDIRRSAQDLDDGRPVLAAQAHKNAWHQREMESHMELVTVLLAEVGAHILGPLVSLGQEHPVAVSMVYEPT